MNILCSHFTLNYNLHLYGANTLTMYTIQRTLAHILCFWSHFKSLCVGSMVYSCAQCKTVGIKGHNHCFAFRAKAEPKGMMNKKKCSLKFAWTDFNVRFHCSDGIRMKLFSHGNFPLISDVRSYTKKSIQSIEPHHSFSMLSLNFGENYFRPLPMNTTEKCYDSLWLSLLTEC